ncbi:MAG: hypothetical protein FD123_3437 [Bacteroidetes bacterium]|nr:MAG: hypothetical protein FD123_3437 [Bacteroidota bacterium]
MPDQHTTGFARIAQASGTVVYEKENKIYLMRQPGSWTSTWLFVSGLLTFIFLANGILQIFLYLDSGRGFLIPGIVLLAAGILLFFVFWKIRSIRRKNNALPAEKLACICIIDTGNDRLLGPSGNTLAALSSVKMKRKMQFGSSSPALVLCWERETLLLVKGNPFSGGVGAIEHALRMLK